MPSSPFAALARYRASKLQPPPRSAANSTLQSLHRLQARVPGPWFMREMLPALHHDLGLAPDVGRVHIRALISEGYLAPVPVPVPRARRYAWALTTAPAQP